jgi:hypothetical protein
MGPVKTMDISLHPLTSDAVQAALPRGHATLAFIDVGVGFVDRAAEVGAVVSLGIYKFYL